MVSVGQMFMGGNVETVVVKAIFDSSGMKTGEKEITKVVKGMNKSTLTQSTYVKEIGNKWKKVNQETKKNAAYYKRIEEAQKRVIALQKQAAKAMIQAKHNRISTMDRNNTIKDSKGNLMAGSNFTTFTKGLDEFQSKIVGSESSIKKIKGGLEEVTTVYKNFQGNIVKTTKKIQQQREQFSMWALSFIFAGMQIKAVSEQITRASVGTFLKISQGQTDAGKAVIGLAANFKFLQFQIGEAIARALKPLMPVLIPIIRGFADIVSRNPGAVFAAIASAFVLGTGMFLGGQMVLFADAVVSLVGKAGGLSGMATSFETISSQVGNLAKYAAGGILIAMGIQDIKEAVTEEDFAKLVTGGLETLSGGLFLAGKTKAGTMALIGTIAFKIASDRDFAEGVVRFFAKISQVISGIVSGIGVGIWEAFSAPFKRASNAFDALKSGDFSTLKSIAFDTIGGQMLGGDFASGFQRGFTSSYGVSGAGNKRFEQVIDQVMGAYDSTFGELQNRLTLKEDTQNTGGSFDRLRNSAGLDGATTIINTNVLNVGGTGTASNPYMDLIINRTT